MTDEMWLQGFNDAGNMILGRTANELTVLREENDTAFMQQMASASGKSYNFTVRAKQDTYNVRPYALVCDAQYEADVLLVGPHSCSVRDRQG